MGEKVEGRTLNSIRISRSTVHDTKLGNYDLGVVRLQRVHFLE